MSTLTPAEDLKANLHLTPKTVSLLLKAGYKSHTELTTVTPNELLQQIANGLNTTLRRVDGYRRACRWMVWRGTQKGRVEKTCQLWTVGRLKARGVWVDGFDDLTGEQIEERFRRVDRMKDSDD